ncbi:50S ribosomal protein L40e [Candidatus Norongarragalina meridionalis]|nr:50S ribosomal protein L40e [Candidatus Norongarragalina meridionalis]
MCSILMGKFPIADKAFTNVLVCKKCKARNPKGSVRCRKCNYPNLRPKRAKKKEAKGK